MKPLVEKELNKTIQSLWEKPYKNLTLEYIFRRHIPHIEVISILDMKDHYEAKIAMKWYAWFTFGILKNRTERKIFDLWYDLHVSPSTLNIIFV